MLNRLSYSSTLSHLRRINSPIGREGKLAKPRQLHNSLWGMICPAETPEGQAVGLAKNLALMALVSVGFSSEPISRVLGRVDDGKLGRNFAFPHRRVDEDFCQRRVGRRAQRPGGLGENACKLRRQVDVDSSVSVVHDIRLKELRLYTDYGRCTRPLFIVDEDQKLRIKKQHIELLTEKDGRIHLERAPSLRVSSSTWTPKKKKRP